MTPTLRPATPEDGGLLLEWANSPDSLAGKLETKQPIPWAEHSAWLACRLADASCQIHIVECNGAPIGQIRIERKRGSVEVDIYIKREFRGRGAGLDALKQALTAYRRTSGPQEIVARIRAANWISQKLFYRAGFIERTSTVDHVVLVLPRPRLPRRPNKKE